MSDVKTIIGWDNSELGKERELANSSVEPRPAFTSKIKLNYIKVMLMCKFRYFSSGVVESCCSGWIYLRMVMDFEDDRIWRSLEAQLYCVVCVSWLYGACSYSVDLQFWRVGWSLCCAVCWLWCWLGCLPGLSKTGCADAGAGGVIRLISCTILYAGVTYTLYTYTCVSLNRVALYVIWRSWFMLSVLKLRVRCMYLMIMVLLF